MRQIRPKMTRHFDEDLAAFEREEELLRTPPGPENCSEKKKRLFRPLPAAEYQTSQVALQQQVTSPNQHLKALPKVFGVQPTVEAKVYKQRIPSVPTSLKSAQKCWQAKRASFAKKFVFCSKKLLFEPFW